jgi:hypothetical protein
VSGAQLDRVFHVRGGAARLHDLTVTGGRLTSTSSSGGGLASSSDLTLEGVTVRGNQLTGSSSRGGGLSISGTVEIRDTVIADNLISGNSGTGAGLFASSAEFAMSDTTVHDNRLTGATSRGAGVSASFSSVAVSNSTFSGNESTIGGSALYGYYTPLDLAFVAIAGNQGPVGLESIGYGADVGATLVDHGAGSACAGGVNSLGYNVASDATCGPDGPGDVVDTSSLLSPLADNGGSTPTLSPHANSPAVDLVPLGTPGWCDGSVATDQRGQPRPDGAGCDSGAVEGDNGVDLLPLDLVVDDEGDATDSVPGDGVCATAGGACSLRAAISEANERPTTDTITIAVGVDPELTISGSGDDVNAADDLDVRDHLTLVGNGSTVSTEMLSQRVIHHLGGRLVIENLTVAGGRLTSTGGQGAGIRSVGRLELSGVSLVGNTVTGSSAQGAGPLRRRRGGDRRLDVRRQPSNARVHLGWGALRGWCGTGDNRAIDVHEEPGAVRCRLGVGHRDHRSDLDLQ